jgi:hypothetical protein
MNPTEKNRKINKFVFFVLLFSLTLILGHLNDFSLVYRGGDSVKIFALKEK